MSFKAILEVDAKGQLRYWVEVPNGTTVFRKEVAYPLAIFLGWATAAPDQRINTLAEQAAWEEARRLPTGWAPTDDAIGTELDVTKNERRFSRTWRRGTDGATATAPCEPDGSSMPETREALIAYDVANPPANAPEA